MRQLVAGFNDFHVDVLIRFARAGAELQAVADFALQLFDRFRPRGSADFKLPHVAAVVPGLPLAAGEFR